MVTDTITPKVDTEVTTHVVFTTGGVAADPTTVTCTIVAPDGTEIVLTYNPGDITRLAVGTYEAPIMVTMSGTWEARWQGADGGPIVVDCRTFNARRC